MTFALGLFDLFAYSIPGFLYISVFVYVAVRMDWINIVMADVKDVPSLLLVIGTAIICYLIGHITSLLGKAVDLLFYRRSQQQDAVRLFAARTPSSAEHPGLNLGLPLLQAKVELANREVAAEITRLRAIGLMLRNCTLPLLFGGLCALTELFSGREKWFGAWLTLLFALLAAGAVWQSRTMRHWANQKTLELAFWEEFTENAAQLGSHARDPGRA